MIILYMSCKLLLIETHYVPGTLVGMSKMYKLPAPHHKDHRNFLFPLVLGIKSKGQCVKMYSRCTFQSEKQIHLESRVAITLFSRI